MSVIVTQSAAIIVLMAIFTPKQTPIWVFVLGLLSAGLLFFSIVGMG